MKIRVTAWFREEGKPSVKQEREIVPAALDWNGTRTLVGAQVAWYLQAGASNIQVTVYNS